MLLGQGANFFLQAGYFILLARLLGVNEYGVFAGAFALINIVTPYSALGTNMLFMRYVTRDRDKAPVYWGNMLIITLAVSLLFAGSLYFLGPMLTKIHDAAIFVVLVFANCLLGQIAALGSTVFQTLNKMRWTATLSFLSNLARFLVLLVMQATLHHATAFQWSLGVLTASACAALISLIWVTKEVGMASFDFSLMRLRIWEGFGFSFAGTTQALYNDVDKTMLSHYGLSRENGFYTLAYRIVDFSTVPIAAMDAAVLPRFFQLGHDKNQGLKGVVKLAVKSTRVAALLGIAICAGTLIVAPFVPRIVGKDFSGVLIALRWLAWLPMLRGVHRMTGGALTGSGHQSLRTGAQITVAVLNFLMNLWWIPVYGWIGAAWSSVASDGLLAVLNALLLFWLWQRVSRAQPEVALEPTET
jgi:O-antigen/teichoic acid export membrane protein